MKQANPAPTPLIPASFNSKYNASNCQRFCCTSIRFSVCAVVCVFSGFVCSRNRMQNASYFTATANIIHICICETKFSAARSVNYAMLLHVTVVVVDCLLAILLVFCI